MKFRKMMVLIICNLCLVICSSGSKVYKNKESNFLINKAMDNSLNINSEKKDESFSRNNFLSYKYYDENGNVKKSNSEYWRRK